MDSDLGFSDKPAQVHFWIIGNKYFIRTVTMALVGRLKSIDDKELVLSDASWIADTGRFSDAMKTGDFDEVEPFCSDILINRSSIVDATNYAKSLPLSQK